MKEPTGHKDRFRTEIREGDFLLNINHPNDDFKRVSIFHKTVVYLEKRKKYGFMWDGDEYPLISPDRKEECYIILGNIHDNLTISKLEG